MLCFDVREKRNNIGDNVFFFSHPGLFLTPELHCRRSRLNTRVIYHTHDFFFSPKFTDVTSRHCYAWINLNAHY